MRSSYRCDVRMEIDRKPKISNYSQYLNYSNECCLALMLSGSLSALCFPLAPLRIRLFAGPGSREPSLVFAFHSAMSRPSGFDPLRIKSYRQPALAG